MKRLVIVGLVCGLLTGLIGGAVATADPTLAVFGLVSGAPASTDLTAPSLLIWPPNPNLGRFHYLGASSQSQPQKTQFGTMVLSYAPLGYRIRTGAPVRIRYSVRDRTRTYVFGLTVYAGLGGSRIVVRRGAYRANRRIAVNNTFTWKHPPSGKFRICVEALDVSEPGSSRGRAASCVVVSSG